MKGRAGLLLVALALLPSPATARAEDPPPAAAPIPVEDFEAPEIREGWTGDGAKLRLVQSGNGAGLEIRGTEIQEFSIIRASGPLPVKDLRRIGSLAFRAVSPGGGAALSVFLRKGSSCRVLEETYVKLSKEMTEYVLPLKFMTGGGSGFLPDPADLDRIVFQWEAPKDCVIVIDDVRLLPGDRGEESWRPSVEDIREIAFGKGKGRVVLGKRYALLSEHEDWDGSVATRFLDDAEKGLALLESVFGLKAPPGPRFPLIGAANLEDGNRLRSRVLAQFRAKGLESANALDRGFEPYSIAYAPPRKKELGHPNVYGTEDHIQLALGLSHRCWLVGAIEASVRRRADPDGSRGMDAAMGRIKASDFAALLRGKPEKVPPWSEMLIEHPEMRGQLALVTVGEFLAARHRANLPKVWDAVRALPANAPEDVLPAVAEALGTTPWKLEAEWARWGAASWK